MTLQQTLATAILARGYKEIKGSGKYRKFTIEPTMSDRPLSSQHHFILLGSAGACRLTNGSIANSRPISTQGYERLIAEGKSLKAKPQHANAAELGL